MSVSIECNVPTKIIEYDTYTEVHIKDIVYHTPRRFIIDRGKATLQLDDLNYIDMDVKLYKALVRKETTCLTN